MKTETTKLIDILQLAIRDFIQKVEAAPMLSAADIEKANFIVGTAKMNVFVLEQIEMRCEQGKAKIDRFLRESAQFAASLQDESCGIPAKLTIP